MSNFDHFLDARQLRCPMPLLKMKQALNGLASGEILQVVTTDPGSRIDFKVWLDQVEHELLEDEVLQEEKSPEYLFRIRKS